MASSSLMRHGSNCTSTGWPGCSFAAVAGSKTRLDHEDELAAALLAVDDRRRVFRLRRNEAHLAGERLAHAIDEDPHAVARMDRADARLRHKGAHLDVRRRQQRHHRPARRDPFALPIERVEDQAGLRRRSAASAKGPNPPWPAPLRAPAHSPPRRRSDRCASRAAPSPGPLPVARRAGGPGPAPNARDRSPARQLAPERTSCSCRANSFSESTSAARACLSCASTTSISGWRFPFFASSRFACPSASRRSAWSRAAFSAPHSSAKSGSPAFTCAPRCTESVSSAPGQRRSHIDELAFDVALQTLVRRGVCSPPARPSTSATPPTQERSSHDRCGRFIASSLLPSRAHLPERW